MEPIHKSYTKDTTPFNVNAISAFQVMCDLYWLHMSERSCRDRGVSVVSLLQSIIVRVFGNSSLKSLGIVVFICSLVGQYIRKFICTYIMFTHLWKILEHVLLDMQNLNASPSLMCINVSKNSSTAVRFCRLLPEAFILQGSDSSSNSALNVAAFGNPV